jgi:hypothetical protein
MEQEEYEAMRQRALRPFKPSITDEDIREFEEKIRQKSLENMKKLKDQIKQADKERIMEKSIFEHHI